MAFDLDKYKEDTDFQAYTTELLKPFTKAAEGLKKDISKLKKDKKKAETDKTTLEETIEAMKTKDQEGETDLEKQFRLAREQHSTEIKELKDEVKLLSTDNKVMKVDATLSVELAKAGCKDVLLETAIKLIKPDVTLEMVEGERVAMVGDKTIKAYVKSWADTEVGKTFIVAKRNSGGDGKGSEDPISKDEAEKLFDPKSSDFNATKQLEIKKENEALYKKLIKKHNIGMFNRLYPE